MVSHYARAYTFVSYVVKSSKICNDMQRHATTHRHSIVMVVPASNHPSAGIAKHVHDSH